MFRLTTPCLLSISLSYRISDVALAVLSLVARLQALKMPCAEGTLLQQGVVATILSKLSNLYSYEDMFLKPFIFTEFSYKSHFNHWI